MKKWLIGFCLLILLGIGAVYFLIPVTQNITNFPTVNCTKDGASRIILNKDKIQSWWPGEKKDSNIFEYKNCNYRFDKILMNGIETTVFTTRDSAKCTFQLISEGLDSSTLVWTSSFTYSANPVKRFFQYIRCAGIRNNTENLLAEIKKYFEKEENIYGMKVTKQKVADPSLISTKQTFSHYPTTEEIYQMVSSLKDYIKRNGGEETNYPMLHVYQDAPFVYETMVAIPTKKDLPSNDKFRLKKMVLGNILMAEVKGGIYTVLKGEQELENYVRDYKKNSPAIPFQSLVTNRLTEPDTSKWITKLYYPIFF